MRYTQCVKKAKMVLTLVAREVNTAMTRARRPCFSRRV